MLQSIPHGVGCEDLQFVLVKVHAGADVDDVDTGIKGVPQPGEDHAWCRPGRTPGRSTASRCDDGNQGDVPSPKDATWCHVTYGLIGDDRGYEVAVVKAVTMRSPEWLARREQVDARVRVEGLSQPGRLNVETLIDDGDSSWTGHEAGMPPDVDAWLKRVDKGPLGWRGCLANRSGDTKLGACCGRVERQDGIHGRFHIDAGIVARGGRWGLVLLGISAAAREQQRQGARKQHDASS